MKKALFVLCTIMFFSGLFFVQLISKPVVQAAEEPLEIRSFKTIAFNSTTDKPETVQHFENEEVITLDLTCDDIEYLATEHLGKYYGQFRIHHSRNNLSFIHTGSNSIYPLYYEFFLNEKLLDRGFVPPWPEGSFSTYIIVPNINNDVLDPGQYNLKAIIDPHNNFQEINKENNVCEKIITVDPL